MAKHIRKSDDNEIFSHSPDKGKLGTGSVKNSFKAKRNLAIALSVLMVIIGVGLISVYSILQQVNYKPIADTPSTADPSSGIVESDAVTLNPFEGELLNDPMILNVMIFGEDTREAGSEFGRSDTMLLLSIDNRHKKLKITSFLRDTLVTIPGTDDAGSPRGLGKLNSAYTMGGPALSVQTIETNFGVEIDRYAIVNFDSFKEIIDVLGGIDIELNQDEIDYINWQTYINKQSDERYELTDEPGMVHLNGRQALWYARNRGYEEAEHPEFVVPGNDFDRTSRQRNLMKKLLEDFKEANLAQVVQIVGKIGPMIETNLKKDEITMLVSNSLTYLSYDNEEFRLPEGEPEDGMYSYKWFDASTDTVYDSSQYGSESILVINSWETSRYNLARFIYEDSVVKNEEFEQGQSSIEEDGQLESEYE